MNNKGKLIVNKKYWTDSFNRSIDKFTDEYKENEYSLLYFKFNKNRAFHMIHLQIPEYGFHLTLVPDDYLQFHRLPLSGWGTRVSYGSTGEQHVTHEFYLDRAFPWFICPIIDHNDGILRVYMFKYEDNETDPTFYFMREYMRQRGMKDHNLKDEFIYEDPGIANVKKKYREMEFEKVLDHTINVGAGPTINVSDSVVKELFKEFDDSIMYKELNKLLGNYWRMT